ncbi:MAG: hypothetical protein NTX24_01940 [Candidatus Pacearchaeota archaeon]|nr:hypothetical protein [Candidatus Pacearchaeota archaeon]
MKKQILLLFTLIFLTSIIHTAMASDIYDYCILDASIVSQDPSPAAPGEYVNIIFQLTGVDSSECDGAKFGIIPEYPFSLDDNESTRILESNIYAPNSKEVWTIPYKIRVDKDAINGENDLKVRYNEGNSDDWNTYSTKTFNITIQDSRTSFDAVIQETSGSEVSIAIANTGRYTANSMIVRIPEQDNFKVSGTNGQMVGNLDSGDYTIVGFTVTQNIQRTLGTTSPPSTNQKNLKVQIDYTDGIGERRTSVIELPLEGNSASANSTASFPNGNGFGARRQNTSIFSLWYFWVIIVVLLLVGFGFYNKYKTRIKNYFAKLKDKFKKKSNEEKHSETPDWVKKEKAKGKK